MKRLKAIYQVTFLAIILLLASAVITTSTSAENTQSKPLSQKTLQLSPDDWKIVIDEKKSSNEFGFIQKNLDSSNLADNGQFLLIAGITLLLLSGVGVIFFSLCLYKLRRKSPQKRAAKRGGTRYK